MSLRRKGPRVVLIGSGIAAAVTLVLGVWFGITPVRARLAVHDLETGETAEREAAARLLGVLGQCSTVPALVRALAELVPGKEHVRHLTELLLRDDAWVRADTLEVLRSLRGETARAAEERLTAILEEEPPQGRQNLLLEGLAALDLRASPRTIEAVMANLGDPRDTVGAAVVEALTAAGGRAVEALLGAAISDSPVVRRRAILALGRLGNDPAGREAEVRQVLERSLDDRSPLVRVASAEALHLIGVEG